MGLLAWIAIGVAAGLLLRSFVSEWQTGALFISMVIGVGGAMFGGMLGNAILGVELTAFTFWSILLSIIGTIALLAVYRFAVFRTPHRQH